MLRLIGIVPLGIGLTVLTFAWSNDFGGPFGSVPIFFRLFASFIALFFIIIGAGFLFGGGGLTPPQQLIDKMLELHRKTEAANRAPETAARTVSAPEPRTVSQGYVCPSCNAPLGGNADVSPHGDVKCGHCGRWFNVHGR